MGGVANAAAYIASAFSVAAGVRLGCRRHDTARARGRRYLAIGMVAIGMAVALQAPGTLDAAATIHVVPRLTRLLGDLLTLAATFSVLVMSARDAQQRRLATVGAGLCCIGITVDVLIPPVVSTTGANQDGWVIGVVGYSFLYVAYIGWAAAVLLRLVQQRSRRTSLGWLPVGLHVALLSGIVSSIWAVRKITSTVLMTITATTPRWPDDMAEIPISAVVILFASVLALPSWAFWTNRIVVSARALIDYCSLAPLWEQMTNEVPQVTLPEAAKVSDIRYALYRRVIEIRDAQLILHEYPPSSMTAGPTQPLGQHTVEPEGLADIHRETRSLMEVYPVGERTSRTIWKTALTYLVFVASSTSRQVMASFIRLPVRCSKISLIHAKSSSM